MERAPMKHPQTRLDERTRTPRYKDQKTDPFKIKATKPMLASKQVKQPLIKKKKAGSRDANEKPNECVFLHTKILTGCH